MSVSERWLVYPALLAAAGLIAYQAVQYRDLAEEHRELRERWEWPHPGYGVPAFRAETSRGDTVRVGEGPGGGAQTLFVFTTTCPYCRATLPAWKEIAEAVAGMGDATVVGLALDEEGDLAAYREEHALNFPVAPFPDRKTERLYRAGSVPLTVVLDGNGYVSYSRLGVPETRAAVDSVLAAIRAAREKGAEVYEGGPDSPADPGSMSDRR